MVTATIPTGLPVATTYSCPLESTELVLAIAKRLAEHGAPREMQIHIPPGTRRPQRKFDILRHGYHHEPCAKRDLCQTERCRNGNLVYCAEILIREIGTDAYFIDFLVCFSKPPAPLANLEWSTMSFAPSPS